MSTFDLFEECKGVSDEANTTALLQCISDALAAHESERTRDSYRFLYSISGGLVFFMQAGFAMLCAGSVRVKNVQNTMLKNLLDACGAAIAFFLVGYAFAFGGMGDEGGTTFIGSEGFATTGSNPGFWFFQWAFSASSVTIVAGTLAERCQMAAYLCYSVFLAGFVYPVVVHSIWSNHGFLSLYNADPLWGSGALDFAGSGVVHATGGSVALYATLVLGPRRGRFYDEQGEPLETPKPFPGHSVALQVLGTMILWFGWFGFNAGSALQLKVPNIGEIASLASINTAISGATAGITALFTNLYLEERRTGEPVFSLPMCMNGALAGLVAITSSCGVIEPWAAIVIGSVAGWLYLCFSSLLIRWRIDDVVNAIPVHMFNGAWGLIATGFFASPRRLMMAYGHDDHPGWFYSLGRGKFDAILLANQICAVLFIFSWTFGIMMPFFVWLNYMGWLRADSLEELVGLDISYHGGSHTAKDGVKKEYIEAYKRHKGALRQRGQAGADSTFGSGGSSGLGAFGSRRLSHALETSVDDPEISELAAAEEALNEEAMQWDEK